MSPSGSNKTVRELIQVTSEYLADRGIESARLNAERLLADVLGLARIELYFQHDRPVMGKELDEFRDLVRLRAGGQPLQTILGQTEFYSHLFKVLPGVFIPRPETEHLVEAAANLLGGGTHRLLAPVAVEIGCGTGVVGISLAMDLPRLTLHATDINPKAIELTRHNAHALGVEARVHVHHGSRFDPLPDHLKGEVDILVSNPPYIRCGDIEGLSEEVKGHDPHTALDGGQDGLDFYHALAAALKCWLRPGGYVAVEIGCDQGAEVQDIFSGVGAEDIVVIKDYSDRDRVVTARVGVAENDREDG
ncbi:MAG: peptide chain release factor N(5)-glutamine methyltransferase [Gemmatimonadales bacterium]|nr:peptide chain release factor N(5)-glutamine methyltransferase [Gemmatimonadales bacterium]